MLHLIVRRTMLLLPTLLVVSFGIFVLISLVPGDPSVTLAGGIDASPQRIEKIREELRLDEPILERYAAWLGNAVTLDFGESISTGRPVADEIGRRIPPTISVLVSALLVAVTLSVPFGLIAGSRAGGAADRAIRLGSSLGMAIPSFWLATISVMAFAVSLKWFPASGYVAFSESPVEWCRHLLLPGIALGLATAAMVARHLRSGLVEAIEAPYVRTAFAKGATNARVVGKHAFKNAAMPAVTTLGLQIGHLLGGAVIIETIFAIPGLGSLMVESVVSRDLPTILGVAMLYAILQVLLNLGVDLSYGVLDPRVRLE